MRLGAGRASLTGCRQIQPVEQGRDRAYASVWQGLGRIWREEGFAGFMRGNGINCIRIAPYSAVQFSVYEASKRALGPIVERRIERLGGREAHPTAAAELHALMRLTAGAIAGTASVVSTYPLDLVRSRISIASASVYVEQHLHPKAAALPRVPGIVEMTLKVYREEGVLRGLYRGCVPTTAVRLARFQLGADQRRAWLPTWHSTFSSTKTHAAL